MCGKSVSHAVHALPLITNRVCRFSPTARHVEELAGFHEAKLENSAVVSDQFPACHFKLFATDVVKAGILALMVSGSVKIGLQFANTPFALRSSKVFTGTDFQAGSPKSFTPPSNMLVGFSEDSTYNITSLA